MTGKEWLDTLVADITAFLTREIEHWFGPGANTDVVGPITGTDLAAMFCFTLFILLVNALVHLFLRH